jgi:hypothetical protein
MEPNRWSTLCVQRAFSFDCFVNAPNHIGKKSDPIASYPIAKAALKLQEGPGALAPVDRERSGEHEVPAVGRI